MDLQTHRFGLRAFGAGIGWLRHPWDGLLPVRPPSLNIQHVPTALAYGVTDAFNSRACLGLHPYTSSDKLRFSQVLFSIGSDLYG